MGSPAAVSLVPLPPPPVAATTTSPVSAPRSLSFACCPRRASHLSLPSFPSSSCPTWLLSPPTPTSPPASSSLPCPALPPSTSPPSPQPILASPPPSPPSTCTANARVSPSALATASTTSTTANGSTHSHPAPTSLPATDQRLLTRCAPSLSPPSPLLLAVQALPTAEVERTSCMLQQLIQEREGNEDRLSAAAAYSRLSAVHCPLLRALPHWSVIPHPVTVSAQSQPHRHHRRPRHLAGERSPLHLVTITAQHSASSQPLTPPSPSVSAPLSHLSSPSPSSLPQYPRPVPSA